MATANLPWSFGGLSGYQPLANCAITVLVTRDGTPLPSFVMNTDAAGNASGTYVDNTADPVATHAYQFTPQTSGCAASALITPPPPVNWNCAGTAPPPPPPPPPPSGGSCPTTADSFAVCGETAGVQVLTVGVPFTQIQGYIDSTSVTVNNTVPGLTPSTTSNSGTITGTPTTPGNFSAVFRGIKAGCPDCVVTYPFTVVSGVCSTQSWTTIQGDSAFPVPTNKSLNSAKQKVRMEVTGPSGQTFRAVATGSVNSTSVMFTIPGAGTGTASYEFEIGQASGYATNWSVEPFGPNPITLCNPGATLIKADTCVLVAITQGGSSWNLKVTSNTVPLPEGMPFTVNFAGTGFGGTLPPAGCVGAVYTFPTAGPFTLGDDGTVPAGELTYGPIPVTAPYDVVMRVNLTETEHQICGPSCGRVTFV